MIGAYALFIPPEEAFGKKKSELIQLISKVKFEQHDINPMPGLQVNIDGIMGTIKNVSGGRILVDFNHPLSGKEVIYTVKVNKIVTDNVEKINGFLKTTLNIQDANVEIKEGKATITLKNELPKGYEEELSKKLKEVIKDLKEVSFAQIKEKEAETPPK